MKREMEMEEMSMRHVEIKKEPQDLKDISQVKGHELDTENFKEETSYQEYHIDKNEGFSNETVNDNVDFEEDKPLKKKKQKKKSMKFLPEPPAGLVENYYDFDLSAEFLSQLFEYVNELCEHINNGDSNINR